MRSARLGAAALGAIALAVFAQAARFPLTCWDDPLHLGTPLSLLTRPLGYPIPLTVASYALLGRSALAAHAWNVALHLVVALLVLALSFELWRDRRAIWPALLFAAHPLVAEPVAWATGRKDLLAAALVLSPVLLHVRRRRPLVTTILYALALACKPSALPLPAILWAYDRLLAPERKSGWLFALAPLAIVDLLLAASGDRALGGIRAASLPFWEHVPLAAALEAAHLFAPVDLLPRYMPRTVPAPRLAIALGLVVLAALVSAPLLLRRRAKVAAFAIAYAGLAYLPAADLLHRTRFVADSYLYLPLTGLCLLFGSRRIPRWAPPVLLALYLPLCFFQVRTWRSNVTLFAPVAAAYPDSPTAWKQLGDSYMCDGDPARAVPIYESVEARFPGNTVACGNLGLAYARLGRRRDAVRAWERGAQGGDPKAAAQLARVAERRGSVLDPRR